MTAALEGGKLSAARPGCTLPPGKSRYLLYRRLGGPQGRSRRTENIVPYRDSIPDRPARSPATGPKLEWVNCLQITFSCTFQNTRPNYTLHPATKEMTVGTKLSWKVSFAPRSNCQRRNSCWNGLWLEPTSGLDGGQGMEVKNQKTNYMTLDVLLYFL